MIYLRKFMDMIVLSVIPSLVSFLLMSGYLNYVTWYVGSIISTIVFFVGNGLLIRRFVRDIKKTSTYYMVWLITFAVYVAGGILCLVQDWMYPFTWIYFHTRMISIVTMTTTQVPVWVSFTISSLAFLALIFIERPIAMKCYEKEVKENKDKEMETLRLARETQKIYRAERMKAEQRRKMGDAAENAEHTPRQRANESNKEELFSMRQIRKMEKINNAKPARRHRQIGMQKATGRKTLKNLSTYVLNLGSYSFYQFLSDKVEQGNNPKPIIMSYIRRRLNLGIKAPKK